MANLLATVGIYLVFLYFSLTSVEVQSSEHNDKPMELLKALKEKVDNSIKERSNQRQNLKEASETKKNDMKKEIASQFKVVLEMDIKHHYAMKTALEKILETIESNPSDQLGSTHMNLIKILTESIETSRNRDKQELESLDKLYGKHQLELKNEITSQVGELNSKRYDQAEELKGLVQKVLYSLGPAKSCDKAYEMGYNKSGIYRIRPDETETFPVYCEMENGEVWTVIQRRGDFNDGPVDFNRSWTEYKNGFGNLNGEFWLGNEKVRILTEESTVNMQLFVLDINNRTLKRSYDRFGIYEEGDSYKLYINGLQSDQFTALRSAEFSTYDRNSRGCYDGAGWWYMYDCRTIAHLNGPKNESGKYGFTFDGETPLLFSTIKIKPIK